MSTGLGDLPGFNKPDRSRRSRTFDKKFESLLSDHGGQDKHQDKVQSGGASLFAESGESKEDFYSQMAHLAGGDGDGSEGGTDEDGDAVLPDSLNMDDLDANLFDSLSSRKKTTADKANPKRGGADIQPRPKSVGTLNPRGTSSRLKDGSTTKRSGGDFDMGELSKLLGTEDIMKDLSSTMKPTRDFSSVRRAARSLKPNDAASEKIKDEADNLLDILSSMDDDLPGVKISTPNMKPTEKSNKMALTEGVISEDKPITPTMSKDVGELGVSKNVAGPGREEVTMEEDQLLRRQEEVHKVSTGNHKLSAVNFDDEDDDDLLAGLGLERRESEGEGRGGEEGGRGGEEGGRGGEEGGRGGEVGGRSGEEGGRSGEEGGRGGEEGGRSGEEGGRSGEEGGRGGDVGGSRDEEGRSGGDRGGGQTKVVGEKNEGGRENGVGTLGGGTLEFASNPEVYEEGLGQFSLPEGLSKSALTRRRSSSSSDSKKSVRFSEKLVEEEHPPLSSPPPGNTAAKPALKSSMDSEGEEKGEELGERQTADFYRLKEGQSVGEKLEHPIFPWQKSAQKAALAPLTSVSDDLRAGKKRQRLEGGWKEDRKAEAEEKMKEERGTLEGGLGSSRDVRPSPYRPSLDSEGVEREEEFDNIPPGIGRKLSDLHRFKEEPVGEKLEHPLFPWQKSNTRGLLASGKPPDDAFRAGRTREKEEGGGKEDSNGEDLRKALRRAEEAEAALRKEQTEHAQCKNLLVDAEKKLKDRLSKQERLGEEVQALEEKAFELEKSKKNLKSSLTAELEQSSINLHRVEMECSHMQELLDSSKQRKEEELEALQRSHSLRVSSLEETLSRRENRWEEELNAEVRRWQEKVQQLEKEKSDAVLSLKCKLDAVEVSKASNVNRLQELHRSTLEDLKRDHEVERQYLVRMHAEQVETYKSANSHTRMLTELSSKVEASARELSVLQTKLADKHSKMLEERSLRNRSQEEHLKVLEEHLMYHQVENEAVRGLLQGLVAKLEANISQQNRTGERERWTLQQDLARLQAHQLAFRDEQASELTKLEENRESLQKSREQFLAEQQEVLTRCFDEQRAIALQREEVARLQRKAEDRSIMSKQMSEQAEAERKSSQLHLSKEAVERKGKTEKLFNMEDQLKVQRSLLDMDRRTLESFAEEIQKRSRDLDETCKFALEIHKRGENELQEAWVQKRQAADQSDSLRMKSSALRERETQIVAEKLSLAEQRRKLQQQVFVNRTPGIIGIEGEQDSFIGVDMGPGGLGGDNNITLPVHMETDFHNAGRCLSQLGNRSQLERGQTPNHVQPCSFIPATLPPLSPKHKSTSIQSYLEQLEQTRGMRQLAGEAQKDCDQLEKEQLFLASLSNTCTSLY